MLFVRIEIHIEIYLCTESSSLITAVAGGRGEGGLQAEAMGARPPPLELAAVRA